MNLLKNFAKKFPLLVAFLSLAFIFGLLELPDILQDGPLSRGVQEVLMAVLVLGWTFLFLGKEKLSFNKNGFGYTYRFLRTYLIILTVLCFLSILVVVISGEISEDATVRLLNSVLEGFAVGIVEEFIFRVLIFGGILQKIGNRKKDIVLAAVLSSILFGVMHIVFSAINGEITTAGTILTALLKTLQTGIFGIVLAFIYFRTRNMWAIASFHSLNDFILFLVMSFSAKEDLESYVSGDIKGKIITYSIFTVMMIPLLVKAIKDIKENEPLPFDEDFLPQAVKYEKKSKKEKESN